MGYVLILGGNSDIGKAVAEKYAFEGFDIYLADVNTDAMEETKKYLKQMYTVQVETVKFNVLEFYTHRNFYKDLPNSPIGAIFAVDYTGDQKRAQKDFLEAKNIIDTNYTGLISILNIIANDFEERKQGFIATISSIVGEDNKEAFYTYHSAKQGLTFYLESLKNKLLQSNVKVIVVKPHFTSSQNPKDMDKPEKFALQPTDIAKQIYLACSHIATKTKKGIFSKFLSFIMGND
jgi:decaprenylphospho-beta-D-erythro-pentofuranosid-2-ulose 2-reductase